MKKQRIKAQVADLILNEGQLSWLPKNPRQWTRSDIDKTIASLKRDPDFQEDSPLKVVQYEDKLLVFGGNLRTVGAKEIKRETFEAILYTPENEEDYETIKRRAILDNGSFGSWDYDMLANEWDDLPLCEMGVPAWETEVEELEQPTNLDDNDAKEKPFVAKITFPDADNMSKFVLAYKNVLEEEYGCTISQSGGLL